MASHWSLVSMRLASASPASSCVLLNSLNALLRANAQGCEDPVGVVTTEGVSGLGVMPEKECHLTVDLMGAGCVAAWTSAIRDSGNQAGTS